MRKASPTLAGNLAGFLLPFIYLGLVLIFDWKSPFRTVTPSLLSMGLLGLAFLLGPRWMILCATIYSLIAGSILMNHSLWMLFSNGYSPPETVSHFYRLAGFLTTAAFSIAFSSVLDRLRAKRQSLNNLIEHLPLPVIVSDADGTMLMMNEKARDFLKIPETIRISDLRYFDLLAPAGRHGRCIAEYLKCFENKGENIPEIPIAFRGQPLSGHFELLQSGPLRLLTMITRSEEASPGECATPDSGQFA
jgi:PAS domain-containing protein